jgi:hypothetical protein
VSKKDLVGAVQSVLQGERLKATRNLRDLAVLLRELSTFTAKITSAGNESLEAWRERDHDDMVLAVALALWFGELPTRWMDVMEIRTTPQAGPADEPMPSKHPELIRPFPQLATYQAVPLIDGSTAYGPDWKDPDEACWGAVCMLRLLTGTAPEVAVNLKDEQKLAIEKHVREWCQKNRRQILPPS